MVSHNDTRRMRMSKIKATLDLAIKKKKEVNRDKLIAECCLEWGTTPKTIKEYLKIIDMTR